MNYKIYTLQHQKLYNQIHSVKKDVKIEKVISKEASLLMDRCKEMRRDFAFLSKIKELDAIFSDVIVLNKKMMYSFEHLVVIANKIFILERQKPYGNQNQLLKEKVNFLKKQLGKDIEINFVILVEENTTKGNCKKIEDFRSSCLDLKANDAVSSKVNEFVINKHLSIDIVDYIYKKYNINVNKEEIKRKSKWVEIVNFKNPFISKYKGNISFLSSCIIFFYIINALLCYSIYAKERLFMFTIVVDLMFLFLLTNILKEIEDKFPKYLKILVLLITLGGFIYLFGRSVYYI